MRRIYQSDLVLHQPLPWSLYDELGNLLLRAGLTLTSQRHLDKLLQRGAYVQLQLQTPPAAPADAAAPASTTVLRMGEPVFVRAAHMARQLTQLHAQLHTGTVPYNMVAVVRQLAHHLIDACSEDADALLAALHLERQASYLATQQLLGAAVVDTVAQTLGMDESTRATLACAALSRDVTLLPEQAQLDKQDTPLTAQQRQWVQGHPARSVALLQQVGVRDALWLQLVQQHHERIDGSGYPAQLVGEAIAQSARLLGIADSYAAMVTPRSNRQAHFPHGALQTLFAQRGRLYDDALLQLTIKTLSVYPPGSLLRLANGETAVVRARRAPRQPLDLWCLYDPQGLPLAQAQPRLASQPAHQITGGVRAEDCQSAGPMLQALWAKATA